MRSEEAKAKAGKKFTASQKFMENFLKSAPGKDTNKKPKLQERDGM